jgi:hypothetical protein
MLILNAKKENSSNFILYVISFTDSALLCYTGSNKSCEWSLCTRLFTVQTKHGWVQCKLDILLAKTNIAQRNCFNFSFLDSFLGICHRCCILDQSRWLGYLQHRIFDAIASVTPEMLRNTWKEIRCCLDVCCTTKQTYVETYRQQNT